MIPETAAYFMLGIVLGAGSVGVYVILYLTAFPSRRRSKE